MNSFMYLELPPPVCRPHLINNPRSPIRILEKLLQCIRDELLEGWVAQQLTDTLDRITVPELNLLSSSIAIVINRVADEF